MEQKPVHIVGAGLAGSEAAWQLVCRGVPVVVHEMKPGRFSPAHRLPGFAELVCSNSLRSDDSEYNAVGLLHQEMRLAGSLVMAAADACRVPAGGALAVDREAFSAFITSRLRGHPLVQTTEEEVSALPPADAGQVIIATGPLTADALAEDIRRQTGEKSLSFYDAIAPVVYTESINMDVAWFQSRYDKGGSRDYINCPLNEEQYNRFVDALLAGEKTEFREFEKAAYFDGREHWLRAEEALRLGFIDGIYDAEPVPEDSTPEQVYNLFNNRLERQPQNGNYMEFNLDEAKKRMPAFAADRVISFADIAMYTEEGEVPLKVVLNNVKKKENGEVASFDYKKASKNELEAYFAEILPTYDRDRVYPTDIKKLIGWYNLLIKAGITDFDVTLEPTTGDNIADREDK